MKIWVASSSPESGPTLLEKVVGHRPINIRVGPLVGDQEATQIFIIYMHDIVLEISFLDINDCPNLSPSNWKLLQKSVKI